jgi:hypothetical protein
MNPFVCPSAHPFTSTLPLSRLALCLRPFGLGMPKPKFCTHLRIPNSAFSARPHPPAEEPACGASVLMSIGTAPPDPPAAAAAAAGAGRSGQADDAASYTRGCCWSMMGAATGRLLLAASVFGSESPFLADDGGVTSRQRCAMSRLTLGSVSLAANSTRTAS